MITNEDLDRIEANAKDWRYDNPNVNKVVLELVTEIRDLRAFGLQQMESHGLAMRVLNDSHRALVAENSGLREENAVLTKAVNQAIDERHGPGAAAAIDAAFEDGSIFGGRDD